MFVSARNAAITSSAGRSHIHSSRKYTIRVESIGIDSPVVAASALVSQHVLVPVDIDLCKNRDCVLSHKLFPL